MNRSTQSLNALGAQPHFMKATMNQLVKFYEEEEVTGHVSATRLVDRSLSPKKPLAGLKDLNLSAISSKSKQPWRPNGKRDERLDKSFRDPLSRSMHQLKSFLFDAEKSSVS